jgi:hypothetical protein
VSHTFANIHKLVLKGDIKVSNHGYDELAEDHIFIRDMVATVHGGQLVEDYPDFGKGPCVLVLQHDRHAKPIHVVWGIPRGHDGPAVLVTAYRPDPAKWTDDFMRRKR